jgi:hypothetical protein
MSKKRERLNQFAYPPGGNFGYASFYTELFQSAVVLLERALRDRLTFAKNSHTHASEHGAGAIVLVVTSFDVWMSEMILGLCLLQDQARERLDDYILAKYRFLYGQFQGGGKTPKTSDLDTVVRVRDEIVHHFQRPDAQFVPDWFPALQQRGLLVTHPSAPQIDFSFTQKLGSYGLTYWAFDVIEASARTLLEGSTNPRAQIHTVAMHNFSLYRRICAPENMHQFDALASTRQKK